MNLNRLDIRRVFTFCRIDPTDGAVAQAEQEPTLFGTVAVTGAKTEICIASLHCFYDDTPLSRATQDSSVHVNFCLGHEKSAPTSLPSVESGPRPSRFDGSDLLLRKIRSAESNHPVIPSPFSDCGEQDCSQERQQQ